MVRGLVVPSAGVIARPPIGAAGGIGLLAEPIAVIAIGVIVVTIDPDPNAIPEDPVTLTMMIAAIMVAIPFERLASATVITIALRARTV